VVTDRTVPALEREGEHGLSIDRPQAFPRAGRADAEAMGAVAADVERQLFLPATGAKELAHARADNLARDALQ
jgi:hypothetical protein